MKHFIYILTVIFFYSCSYPLRKGYKETDYKQVSVLKSDFKKVIYRTTIDVYGKHFSGIMVIKKIEKDTSYRLVFLSELGMKIFDFEFNNNLKDRFKIHQILEPINKKLLISTLRKDFELFLKLNHKNTKSKTYSSNNSIIEKVKFNSLYNYYTYNNDSNYVTQILQKGWLLKKLIITNIGYSENSPDSVNFTHKGINLTINLSKMR